VEELCETEFAWSKVSDLRERLTSENSPIGLAPEDQQCRCPCREWVV